MCIHFAKSYYEEAEEPQHVMKQQKDLRQRLRVKVLDVLKSCEVIPITQLARVLGYDRSTVQRWLRKYQQSGLSGFNFCSSGYNRVVRRQSL